MGQPASQAPLPADRSMCSEMEENIEKQILPNQAPGENDGSQGKGVGH